MRQKKRKRRRLSASANGCHRRRAEAPNNVWCWDLIFGRTAGGSHLAQGLGSYRTRGCLPGSDPTLSSHIAWDKKPKPVTTIGPEAFRGMVIWEISAH